MDVALPLDFSYSTNDSIYVEHFIKSENRWESIKADSIVDDFVYFRTNSFSLFRLVKNVVKAAVYVDVPALGVTAKFSKNVRDIVDGYSSTVATICCSVVNGIYQPAQWIYKLYKKILCFDFVGIKDQLSKTFSSNDKSITSWNLSQNNIQIDTSSYNWKFFENYLHASDTIQLKPLNDDDNEAKKWATTRDNLNLLLTDEILSKLNSDKKNRFDFELDSTSGLGKIIVSNHKNNQIDTLNYEDYFLTSSSMIEDAAWIVDGINACYETFNLTGNYIKKWKDFGNSIDKSYTANCTKFYEAYDYKWSNQLSSTIDCGFFAKDFISKKGYNIFNNHQEKLIAISEAMVRISLLAWLDKNNFRAFSLMAYKKVYDGVLAWLELAAPFLAFNNIAIKSYGSLALYEYIHFGTDNNLKAINDALNIHYSSNGAYSEGADYSEYIWEDLPYLLAALKEAYATQGQSIFINEKFLASPDYMYHFSRPVKNAGYIPVEIDDGCTYNPDYRIWGKLKENPIYYKWANKHPVDPYKLSPIMFLGFPNYNLDSLTIPTESNLLWGDFKDGIGLITAIAGNDTVALSMIAENGDLLENGQSHDQQDNLSITLSSSKKGFIIQDRGYSEFYNRSDENFHRYNNHNVLTYGKNCESSTSKKDCLIGGGQPDNYTISIDELRKRTEKMMGSTPGFFWSANMAIFNIVLKIKDKNYDFTVDGGYEAKVLDKHINNPQKNIIGYTARTNIIQDFIKNEFITNYRTILYFGESFWVIDRPTEKGMVWLANINAHLDSTHLKLYTSNKEPIDLLDTTITNYQIISIKQHIQRNDYDLINNEKKYLTNLWTSVQNKTSVMYIMEYPLTQELFSKTDICLQNFQCFATPNKDKYLIIPPRNTPFKICDILPYNDCSGDFSSTGITMISRNNDAYDILGVLDGSLTITKNGNTKEIHSATTAKNFYQYTSQDGSVFQENTAVNYLPALPLLLLR